MVTQKYPAPIVLIVYNRLKHTKQVVEALKKNSLSKKSILHIFSDAQRSEKDKKNVEDVRDYIKTITGFKKIKVIKRRANYGVSKNMIQAVTKTINKYKKTIVIEDDDVPSKYFLEYMNEALEFYEKEEKVGSISGFLFPLNTTLPETFFLNYSSSWGWATWKNRWELFEKDGNYLYNSLKQKQLQSLFNINDTYPFTRILRNQIRRNNDSWSIRWYASLILKNKLTLYPKKSLIKNIGHDATGIHCDNRKGFETRLSSKPISIKPIKINQNELVYKELQKYFKSIFWERFFSKIKRGLKNPLLEFKNF
jgi:hypothetical protein